MAALGPQATPGTDHLVQAVERLTVKMDGLQSEVRELRARNHGTVMDRGSACRCNCGESGCRSTASDFPRSERAQGRSPQQDSPRRADYVPRRADYSPRRADYAPRQEDYSSHRADYLPRRADYSPRRADYSSRREDYSPRRADYSPGPRRSDYSPRREFSGGPRYIDRGQPERRGVRFLSPPRRSPSPSLRGQDQGNFN